MKKLIKVLFIILVLSFPLNTFSQERKIKLGIQSGWFKANYYYKNIQPGWNIGGEASFFINKNFFLAAHYNCGFGSYIEERRSIFFDSWNEKGNNAELTNINFGILAGYNQPITNRLNVSWQFGIAQFIEICKFPIRIVRPDVLYGWSHAVETSGTHYCVAFPSKFNVGFMLTQKLEIGFAAGFYIEPDYKPAIVGLYCGPQLNVVF